MILATVTTCPQRWEHYRRLLRNFAGLGFSFPLRTFQTKESAGDPLANNNLNARAALNYASCQLPENGWLLYLEDDVSLSASLAAWLLRLVEWGERDGVDVWYLCNRKNHYSHQFRRGELVINELEYPVYGSHGLLIPKRHVSRMVEAHWGQLADISMFSALEGLKPRIWQPVRPVLVEHVGAVSTYDPEQRPRLLEVNYAN